MRPLDPRGSSVVLHHAGIQKMLPLMPGGQRPIWIQKNAPINARGPAAYLGSGRSQKSGIQKKILPLMPRGQRPIWVQKNAFINARGPRAPPQTQRANSEFQNSKSKTSNIQNSKVQRFRSFCVVNSHTLVIHNECADSFVFRIHGVVQIVFQAARPLLRDGVGLAVVLFTASRLPASMGAVGSDSLCADRGLWRLLLWSLWLIIGCARQIP